ncbi:sensor histidine kinase [Propionivibrio soli]|uniref:sensor histidine kinase n=1 Tax=Propionivibrio soli TaxID=2976531 RepID=UPI0021E87952|nr:HAMP domain-containing sensor histidine kinase [Propionivibrio soli]
MRSLLFSPSLTRRVFFALVVAFFIAGAVLTGKAVHQFYADMQNTSGDWSRAGRTLISILQEVEEEAQAVSIVRAMEAQFNASLRDSHLSNEGHPGGVFFQLADANDRLLYASHLPGILAPGTAGQVIDYRVGGSEYRVHAFANERWHLRLGIPSIPEHVLIAVIVHDLVPELLISFPFVLLPLWIAIRTGLRPLSELSERLAKRSDDDLSPLNLGMKYVELERVTGAIESLLARLRGRLERERAFIHDAAHEMRTPIAVIGTQGHVLANAADPASRALAAQSLREAIERASHLSEQLLSLASLDQQRALEKTPVDVAAFLQSLLAQMAPMALKRNIDLSLDAPESAVIPMNRVSLHSIVQNLVDNALRYVHTGGRVAVSLSLTPEHAVLRVADDGPGVPVEDRPQIFERFYRGRNHDAAGTGIGLAIVAKAVQGLGGTISVADGIDGRGVAFVATFRLGQ